ncbi:MAG: hypothetical protein AB1696_16590 [Planctomycetota bacterium]
MSAKRKTSRMGRPPKPKAEKWGARVSVNMTEAEYRQLRTEAKAAGKSLASYLLDCWREGKGR